MASQCKVRAVESPEEVVLTAFLMPRKPSVPLARAQLHQRRLGQQWCPISHYKICTSQKRYPAAWFAEDNPTALAPAVGCPFGHSARAAVLAAATTNGISAAGVATAPAAGVAGRCPFGHGSAAGSVTTHAAAPSADEPHQPANGASLADTIDGVPPLAHSMAAAHTQQQEQQEGAAGAGDGETAGAFRGPAVCPLGFGGGTLGPRMTELHCVLCRQAVVMGRVLVVSL